MYIKITQQLASSIQKLEPYSYLLHNITSITFAEEQLPSYHCIFVNFGGPNFCQITRCNSV